MATSFSFQPAAQLSPVMARQAGLFTAAQARSFGHSAREIERARSRHELVSVRRGVYAVRAAYVALDPEARHRADAHAALLCLKPPVTLSHETAAVWHSMPLLRPTLDVVHVTRPELSAARLEAGIHHHDGALPMGHAVAREAAVVTSLARTAVDLARHLDFARGLAAADSALRQGATHEDLLAVLEFCSSWPGARGAGRVVTAADARAANPGESWSRAVLIEAGIPPTDLQFPVHDGAGLVGFADFVWEECRTLGEFDGRWKYAVPPGADATEAARVLWAEKRREDRLRALGWTVVRWSWEDLFAPDRLVTRVVTALERPGTHRRTA